MLATLRKNDGTTSMVDVPYAAEVIEQDGDYYVRHPDFVYGMPQPTEYSETSFLHVAAQPPLFQSGP